MYEWKKPLTLNRASGPFFHNLKGLFVIFNYFADSGILQPILNYGSR